MPSVQVYDTTLRDGSQAEGISFSCEDKLKIAQRLIKWPLYEGGRPVNPKDVEFFNRSQLQPENARIVAFGSTRRPGRRLKVTPTLKPF